ncbi:Tetratricopeptide-like helical [Phaffia rhodozyma]|uniref:Tetratricopeptide-like helical n=1 Tax=Phaffia rhodozyma TaxID=264483 RepID=A0A0F7SEN2_PHARH|nr:Tetratricopeptide-like helical [Phaffia rhodozyma]
MLAIREPYYVCCPDEVALDDLGAKMVSRIRVESPTDVICLGADDRLVIGLTWTDSPTALGTGLVPAKLSPEQAKLIGNERLKKGWLISAERAYTQGLTVDSKHTVLRLNRAHCRIKLSWFRGAFVDSQHALRSLLDIAPTDKSEWTESTHLSWLQKAYHRAVLALIGLRDWSVAHEHCIAFAEQFPGFLPASDLLAFTKARVDEAQTGIYDWASIYRGDRQPGGMTNVVADWVSPSFKMGYSPTSGGVRGVVADRTIEPGELLVVCKPFASVDPKELKDEANTVVTNLPTKQLESVAQAYLTRAMVDKVKDEPEAWDVLKKLYAGPAYSDPGLVDLSAFRLPGAPSDAEKEDELPNVDVSRLEGIRTYNSFAIKSVAIKETGPSTISLASEETPSGIYLVPSLFNHACFGNVSWNFWGDLMVLRSRQIILPGEELTISYYADHSFDERTRSLLKYGVDHCDCILCTDERLDTPAQRASRANSLADLFTYRDRLSDARATAQEGVYRQQRGTTAKFISLVRSIESTYAPGRSKSMMFELFAPFSILSDVHVNEVMSGMKDPREVSLLMDLAIEWERRALESCGFRGVDSDGKGTVTSGPFVHEMVCVSAGLSIVSLLDGLGRKEDAQRWASVVLDIHKIIFGGGKELMMVLWRGLLDSMDLISFFR